MLAYLVIREGSRWTDVFRLIPGQAVTIGRAPTNQIVLKDERSSRHHAEVFLADNAWILRDLESRNGTTVNGKRILGDAPLAAGDIVQIGRSQLAFVHDLSQAFRESPSGILRQTMPAPESDARGDEPDVVTASDPHVFEVSEPTKITHRRGQSKFLESSIVDSGASKVGRAAAKGFRLAFELAKSPDVTTLANQALAGLFEGTQVDAGAVLLVPRELTGEPTATDLTTIATRTESDLPYQRISSFLATTVLREGEAVLARNAMGDSALGIRDSKGEFHATGVICAPIKSGKRIQGLVHLYSTDETRTPDPDDLEFTLAVANTLAVALQNIARRQELAESLHQARDENQQLRQRLGVESELVGSSPALARISDDIARAAPSKATVLIRGESGVGKELVARAVHYSSPRRKGPFVCLNCAALSESLLESELFGHERGAFTGATERKAGKFEAAHQGTIMLDEIGEMSPAIQAKFLRVLEGHPFERVGGSEQIKVDVRAIAATNRDLEKDVAEGRFRRDLYFRLRVVEIIVPPLRRRTEDIPDLGQYFLHRYNAETGRRIRGFTPRAVERMLAYRWPGNVRELKNVIERAVVLCQADVIDVDDLTLSNLATVGDTAEQPLAPHDLGSLSLDEVERRHIAATLEATGWNKSQTAQILGIERSTLDRKIRRYELVERSRTS